MRVLSTPESAFGLLPDFLGHFLQEDAGDRLAAEIVKFVVSHPLSPSQLGEE